MQRQSSRLSSASDLVKYAISLGNLLKLSWRRDLSSVVIYLRIAEIDLFVESNNLIISLGLRLPPATTSGVNALMSLEVSLLSS